MDVLATIEQVKKQIGDDLKASSDLDELYLKYFSKKHGLVTQLVKSLPGLPENERKSIGPKVNSLQNDIKGLIEDERLARNKSAISNVAIDLTLPVPPKESGYLHPTTQVIRDMNKFFRYHGYSVYEGPEIETDENNFEKLNLPKDHPARDLWDTLFIKRPEILLRTHTSSVETRALMELDPPIRVVTPGKCFRNETPNKTNSSFFYQYQGVVVDEGVTLQNLKSTLEQVHKFLFGDDVELRYRYKYYPEVSPGMGVDMKCGFCEGTGCDVCKGTGWIEMLGSGMIHYNTLKACGIDPEKYTGFAFGMGLDRLVMQKFGVNDIRKLYGGGMVYV